MDPDHDRERHAVQPRDDAAIEFRCARVQGDGVALRRITDRGHAAVKQQPQHLAAVIGRAADQEVLGCSTPGLFQPVDIGLEPAGRRDQRAGGDGLAFPTLGDRRGAEPAAVDVEIDDRRLVKDFDAQRLRGPIKRVEHRPAAAQEEGIGPAEAERAAQRRLEPHALVCDPAQHIL